MKKNSAILVDWISDILLLESTISQSQNAVIMKKSVRKIVMSGDRTGMSRPFP
jgi:thiazole synthase ThiGH ThiG subunit